MFGADFDLVALLIRIPVLLLSLSCHEFAHGFAAYRLGDSTAKRDGRLSFNPIRHIDPIGFIFMIIFRFGWAKPVMVNPRFLKDPKKDMAVISSAGPLVNMLMALMTLLIFHPLNIFLNVRLPLAVFINYSFNDLANIGLPVWQLVLFLLLAEIAIFNVVIGIFNLLPIPPLDGSKIFGSFLPDRLYYSYMRFERYGFIVLIVLIYSGAISGILRALVTSALRVLEFVVRHIYFFLR